MLLVKIIIIYMMLSFTEWFVHSKIMHGDPKTLQKVPIIGETMAKTARTHIEHHSQVEIDMTLVGNHNERSLYFEWTEMLLLGIFIFFPILLLIKNIKVSIIITVLLLLFYGFLWNNIHVDMHSSKKKIQLRNGIPNSPGSLSRGPIYNYLYRYHSVHHNQKGQKYNHNIILPGADFIMGTYQGFYFDNSDYCNEHLVDTRCFEQKYGEL